MRMKIGLVQTFAFILMAFSGFAQFKISKANYRSCIELEEPLTTTNEKITLQRLKDSTIITFSKKLNCCAYSATAFEIDSSNVGLIYLIQVADTHYYDSNHKRVATFSECDCECTFHFTYYLQGHPMADSFAVQTISVYQMNEAFTPLTEVKLKKEVPMNSRISISGMDELLHNEQMIDSIYSDLELQIKQSGLIQTGVSERVFVKYTLSKNKGHCSLIRISNNASLNKKALEICESIEQYELFKYLGDKPTSELIISLTF
jgi:hypothetical protein